ncbi:hypothetical protein BDV37DRAFT_289627 [Aspergillus pseudonomiae]|uniref:Uncharacterized protein n=1 Tax=Aspergillus pseudonomiae TaxID=1506151 RepID=A0A5N7CU04_9EURO|nr:uncharacterized protein BDV37DRAFT_289627 [Aspergillus pseudonomiae]KAE8397207.1 hypothetical protein BDV37DRAFT_289627 [Aspergillus pseudonomiae]
MELDETDHKGAAASIAGQGSSDTAAPSADQKVVEIEVHGLKARIFLNCPEEDLIPSRYLKKAQRSPVSQRTIWLFRRQQNARQVNLNRWSTVDIRFRGVFKTLKKVPLFRKGLYEDDAGHGDPPARGYDFATAVRAQGQVVYALLDEILGALSITRETEDPESYFYLRARLLNCQLEYWTGYREKYKDAPITAGLLALEYYPEQHSTRAVLPVSTTTEKHELLESALEGKFKLLLSQLLMNIHRLHPPGDKFPDQEVFLIGLHGSRLHIFRGIFPGHKTSRLWSGRHNASGTDTEMRRLVVSNANQRFYGRQNLERFMQKVEWFQLSTSDSEPDPRVFRILGSKEYDLWVESDFYAALRLLVGLVMYLMSGRARCGILQYSFSCSPYDEDDEPDSEDEELRRKAAQEEEDVVSQEQKLRALKRQKREEDQERFWRREAMRSSTNDRIGGFKDFRQPWWDWVWEDKHDDGCAKDDADVIFEGP